VAITITKQLYSLGETHRLCHRVRIDGEDFQAVKKAALKWNAWYAPKPGTYHIPYDGSLSNVEVGLLGEVAAATVLGTHARLVGMDGGDGGVDFVLSGPNGYYLPCDVKTIKTKRKGRDYRIGRTINNDYPDRLASTVYILAWLQNQSHDSAVIGLWGFVTDRQVQACPMEPSASGRPFYLVPFSGAAQSLDDGRR
jgi:hypothetical protein